MMLKIMGNETQTAHDGLEAVAMAESFKPEVILMDIGMPKLNGYDACRRIREQPGDKDCDRSLHRLGAGRRQKEVGGRWLQLAPSQTPQPCGPHRFIVAKRIQLGMIALLL